MKYKILRENVNEYIYLKTAHWVFGEGLFESTRFMLFSVSSEAIQKHRYPETCIILGFGSPMLISYC